MKKIPKSKIEKQKAKEANIAILKSAGIKWTEKNKGAAFVIKGFEGKPGVTFYPTTNKWMKAGSFKAQLGDANDLLDWYSRQKLFESDIDLSKRKVDPSEYKHKTLTREDLNDDQLTALTDMTNFIRSSERYYLLKGSAGTGKTATIKVLLDELDEVYDIYCTAPTNEAVKVIARSTARQFDRTIYSLLGLKLQQFEDKGHVLKRDTQVKSKLEDCHIIIVDEASMLSRGLLEVIIEELQTFTHIKMIFIGDNIQLPPVEDNGRDSLAFDVPNRSELTQIMRTTKGNPILDNLIILRDSVTAMKEFLTPYIAADSNFSLDNPAYRHLNNHLASIELPLNFESRTNEDGSIGANYVFASQDRQQRSADFNQFIAPALEMFTSDEYKDDKNSVRVLAFTNKTVNYMNGVIRSHIFANEEEIHEYMVGEDLIVHEPVIDDSTDEVLFGVGERLIVDKVVREEYTKKVKLFGDYIEVKFHYWKLNVTNYEQPVSRRSTEVINVLDSQSMGNYQELLKKMADNARYEGGKRQHWKKFYDMKNAFHSVKYSYSTTIHKSQGSTFKDVYVIGSDMDMLRNWDLWTHNRLVYVAFSRASHRLNVFY